MNLKEMIKAQKDLLDHICNEKGLQAKDLLGDTHVALQVELAEFANEGRWFKYWSENQEPRREEEVKCHSCNGTGDLNYENVQEAAESYRAKHEYIDCPDCDCSGVSHVRNPLLEEFVDGVHFFLQIAILEGWEDALSLYEEMLDPDEFNGNLTGWYLEMTYYLNNAYIRKYTQEENEKSKRIYGHTANGFDFRLAWSSFLNIGLNGFGLTLEQIERAYYAKNEINHERQLNGY